MDRNRKVIDFKIGDLVYLNIENGDGGMGMVVSDIVYTDIEFYYAVFSMRENKIVIAFPYELELVRG
jgi:predicted acetyltransferase